jgi:hypothetical protein
VRADLTLMALARESNRYLLTRLIAKATRKLHRPKTRLQDTMNDAFERFGSKPRTNPPCCGSGEQFARPCCMTRPALTLQS